MNDYGVEPLEVELIVEDGVEPGVGQDSLIDAARETLGRLGVTHAHLAIEIVGEERIHELNLEHRNKDSATDVLSFPIDGEGLAGGQLLEAGTPVELGDVVICPAHTHDIVEAVVHGVLHLCGYDHEEDSGEMFALQDSIVYGLER